MKVKGYKKNILFFLMCIFIAFWFACSNSESGSSLSSGINSETGYIKFNVSSSTLQSKLNIARSVLRSTVSKTDAAKLIVSIEDGSGNNTYVDKELTLYAMGSDFISAPLSLEIGKNYSLTKFLVADKNNNILFATPLKDSAQAKLVTNPLPISLNSITKDTVVKTTPEVVTVDSSTAKDFGYASFDFTIINTFKFQLAVKVYDKTVANWKLTNAEFEIMGADNKTLNSGNLTAITNIVEVMADKSLYTLKITKDNYNDYSQNFTEDELKNFLNNPLKVILKESSILKSCKEILDNGLSQGNGVYKVDPDGTGEIEPFNVYCDMETDDGGWTLIVRAISGNNYHANSDKVGNLIEPTQTSSAKLSDEMINLIPKTIYRVSSDDKSTTVYFDTSDSFSSTRIVYNKAKPRYEWTTWYGPYIDPYHRGLNTNSSDGANNYGFWRQELDGNIYLGLVYTGNGSQDTCRLGIATKPNGWCGNGDSGTVWLK